MELLLWLWIVSTGSEPYSEKLGRLASGDGDDSDKEMIRDGMSRKRCHCLHPGRLTWNIQIIHLERNMIFQTSMIMFHVNLPGRNYWRFQFTPSFIVILFVRPSAGSFGQLLARRYRWGCQCLPKYSVPLSEKMSDIVNIMKQYETNKYVYVYKYFGSCTDTDVSWKILSYSSCSFWFMKGSLQVL